MTVISSIFIISLGEGESLQMGQEYFIDIILIHRLIIKTTLTRDF